MDFIQCGVFECTSLCTVQIEVLHMEVNPLIKDKFNSSRVLFYKTLFPIPVLESFVLSMYV